MIASLKDEEILQAASDLRNAGVLAEMVEQGMLTPEKQQRIRQVLESDEVARFARARYSRLMEREEWRAHR